MIILAILSQEGETITYTKTRIWDYFMLSHRKYHDVALIASLPLHFCQITTYSGINTESHIISVCYLLECFMSDI